MFGSICLYFITANTFGFNKVNGNNNIFVTFNIKWLVNGFKIG